VRYEFETCCAGQRSLGVRERRDAGDVRPNASASWRRCRSAIDIGCAEGRFTEPLRPPCRSPGGDGHFRDRRSARKRREAAGDGVYRRLELSSDSLIGTCDPIVSGGTLRTTDRAVSQESQPRRPHEPGFDWSASSLTSGAAPRLRHPDDALRRRWASGRNACLGPAYGATPLLPGRRCVTSVTAAFASALAAGAMAAGGAFPIRHPG
jgi:hypothetical protein